MQYRSPLVPDPTPFTFGLEMGLTNELPFFDGFSHASHASCDLGSLFGHENDSANWNSGWSGENSRELPNEYMSLPSSSGYLAILPPELEALLATADPSLALGGVSAAVDSPPLHLWGSDDLPVPSSSSPTVDLTQYEISNSEAQNFLGWQWQKSSTRWLDEGVSSEVCHFPEAIKVSDRTKVSWQPSFCSSQCKQRRGASRSQYGTCEDCVQVSDIMIALTQWRCNILEKLSTRLRGLVASEVDRIVAFFKLHVFTRDDLRNNVSGKVKNLEQIANTFKANPLVHSAIEILLTTHKEVRTTDKKSHKLVTKITDIQSTLL
ncbi:hypothetical protein B0H13DRAFT_1930957 [Mycena leptocephala]|nr:hypothetical protein B0H13DRAFT_1930957 [Mycena leptocephala]